MYEEIRTAVNLVFFKEGIDVISRDYESDINSLLGLRCVDITKQLHPLAKEAEKISQQILQDIKHHEIYLYEMIHVRTSYFIYNYILLNGALPDVETFSKFFEESLSCWAKETPSLFRVNKKDEGHAPI